MHQNNRIYLFSVVIIRGHVYNMLYALKLLAYCTDSVS